MFHHGASKRLTTEHPTSNSPIEMVNQRELQRRRDEVVKRFTEKKHECLSTTQTSTNIKFFDAKVETLVQSILKGEVTSYDVTTHLIKMAHEIARKECNALTEEMYDEAILAAQLVDQRVRQVRRKRASRYVSYYDALCTAVIISLIFIWSSIPFLPPRVNTKIHLLCFAGSPSPSK